MKKTNIRRKTFVAREDLLNRLVEVAKAQGCSLFELVNDIFQLAIDSEDLNFSLKRVVDERKTLEMAKGSGFILGLESLWYEMADMAYKKDKRTALKSWFDSGVWFATRYLTNDVQSPVLDQFKSDLSSFTWNAPEFELELTGNKASVKVTSPRFTEAYTFLFASFLDGALGKFGYEPVGKEISRGVIRLDAVRKNVNGTA
ncbi:MAG: hypothetical protein ACQCN3_13685 [Candidatus Bathyarchaeia archaeon]